MEKQTLCTVWVTFMSKLQQGEVTALPSNALLENPRQGDREGPELQLASDVLAHQMRSIVL